MVNYPCAFSQSESGKYFERIIKMVNGLFHLRGVQKLCMQCCVWLLEAWDVLNLL